MGQQSQDRRLRCRWWPASCAVFAAACLLSACGATPSERADRALKQVLGAVDRLDGAVAGDEARLQEVTRAEAEKVRTLRAEIFALSAQLERDDAAQSAALKAVRAALPKVRATVAKWMGSGVKGQPAGPAQALGLALPAELTGTMTIARLYARSGLLDVAEAAETLRTVGAPGRLGGPLVGTLRDPAPNLASWIAFAKGAEVFRRGYSVKDGLGPGFNNASCAGCHTTPTLGGWGGIERGAQFRVNPELHREIIGVHRYHAPGVKPPSLPAGVTVVVRRAPPLYGVGLLDLIPVSAVQARARANQARKDGVRGFANTRVGQVARFGAKSHELSVRTFIAAALKDEMGITSAAHRCDDQLSDGDKAPDPEISERDFDQLAHFVSHLAPPPNRPHNEEQRRGGELFKRIGCDGCHLQEMGGIRGAYTDLLVHRMGRALDNGLPEKRAEGDAWRTAPLWGLRHRPRYLHDDSAETVEAAILKHGGEARSSKVAFERLTPKDRGRVLRFLDAI